MEEEKVETTQTELLSADKWHTRTQTWYECGLAPLVRVTPLSKYLAMALFVVLPFVGFWLGVEWSEWCLPEPVTLVGPVSNTALSSTTTKPSTDRHAILFIAKYTGGDCPMAVCSSFVLFSSGSWERHDVDGIATTGTISDSDLKQVIQLVDTLDVVAVREAPFLDTCPSAYDGIQSQYTLYSLEGAEVGQVFDSCVNDLSHFQVFKVLDELQRSVLQERQSRVDIHDDEYRTDTVLYASRFGVQGMTEELVIRYDGVWTFKNNLPGTNIDTKGVLSSETVDVIVALLAQEGVDDMDITQYSDWSMVCDGSREWEINLDGRHKSLSTPCVSELSSETKGVLAKLDELHNSIMEIVRPAGL